MFLKQILSSTLLLSSSLLANAQYGYGGGGSSGSDGSGSYGSGSGSGSGSYGNQGNQYTSSMDSSTMGSGMGGGGGGKGNKGNSYTTSDQNGQQVETIMITETISLMQTAMMTMTETVTETSCSTMAMATMGGGPPAMGGSGGSWGSGSSTDVSIQIVTVSDSSGALSYFPDSVVAAVGSIVEFQYFPKNHTITQSSFAAPCVPIDVSTPNNTTPGIKSGFVPVSSNATDFLKGVRSSFQVMINDTKPIWIYCGQVGHCQKGMSMVINQNMTDTVKTLTNYQAAAAMVPIVNGTMTMAAPGAASPAESTSTSTFTASAFPPPSATTQPSVVTQQPAQTSTTAAPVAQSTTAAGVATFTGAAQALTVKKMSGVAGVLAMGVVALL